MALTILQKRELMLTADQYIRRHGFTASGILQSLARYLYDRVRPDTRDPFVSYRHIARSALQGAASARFMQDNPTILPSNVPVNPGISTADRRYAYRVVVAGRDADGNEIFSTAVTVESSNILTGQEAMNIATQLVIDNYLIPMSPPPPGHIPNRGIDSMSSYIMLAGRRA